MARFCTTCGTKLVAEDARFCTKCGAAAAAPPISHQSPTVRERKGNPHLSACADASEGPSSDGSSGTFDATGGFENDCSLLGVDEYYTNDELSVARRTKTAQWHPDKLDNMAPELKEFASQQLARFNGAYERLANRVKWNAEPKSLSAEAQDFLALMENANHEWDQALGAVSSGRSLAVSEEVLKLEPIIDRLDDGIRRIRTCLARVLQEGPTIDVKVPEQVISKAIDYSRRMRKIVQPYKEAARVVEELQAREVSEAEVEAAQLAWRAKAEEALSRDPEMLVSDMPVEALKAYQEFLLLSAESQRRMARRTLQDKSLEDAMLKVEHLASIGTAGCLEKAMKLLHDSTEACTQRQI